MKKINAPTRKLLHDSLRTLSILQQNPTFMRTLKKKGLTIDMSAVFDAMIKVSGWKKTHEPIPKRRKDSWLDRLKHRNTFLGRIAQAYL